MRTSGLYRSCSKPGSELVWGNLALALTVPFQGKHCMPNQIRTHNNTWEAREGSTKPDLGALPFSVTPVQMVIIPN